MREESHLDDMRSAIRGDFERLAERRGGQELMNISPEPPAEPEVAPTAEPGGESSDAELTQAEPEGVPSGEDTAEAPPEALAEPPPRSWLDRLLGR